MATERQLAALTKARAAKKTKAEGAEATPEPIIENVGQLFQRLGLAHGLDEDAIGGTGEFAHMRSAKIVVPRCQVPEQKRGSTEYTTGPCQQRVKDDVSLLRTWFKTCTHGPKQDVGGKEIPPQLRPYFEGYIVHEKVPVIEAGIVKEWEDVARYAAKLRLTQVVVDRRAHSGQQLGRALVMGALPAVDFGLGPYCEDNNCYRKDVERFKNGLFCARYHAARVKIRETGVALPLGSKLDGDFPIQTSSAKRAEVLRAVEV